MIAYCFLSIDNEYFKTINNDQKMIIKVFYLVVLGQELKLDYSILTFIITWR